MAGLCALPYTGASLPRAIGRNHDSTAGWRRVLEASVAMTVQFAGFVFDEDRRQLLHGGEVLHLEPKAFELLALLLSRRPNAVSKPEIREAIWPGAHVSESSLPGLVGDLRGALGDDSKDSRFIRTVPRYGYAFCADVVVGAAAPAQAARWTAVWASREVPLPDGEHLIGRGEDCRIRSDSSSVSRHHALVRVTSERLLVEDLGSRNGTWVRGRRLAGPEELTAGEAVRVGPELIRFVTARNDDSTVAD
jgi:DNA-binding winged helix-turn-helix (wHTH) protein